MRTRLLMLGIILIFSLIPFPARPAWEEDSQPQFSPVPQYGDTTLEDLIIELEDPPMVEFKFPRIEGFQVSVAAMRHRLHRSRVQKNFQAQLFRFLDMADGNWKKDPDNLFRGTGFRRSLDLYRFFIILWSRLRLMDRADADFLVQKAKRALYEFEVETAVLQVRKTLSDSHSKLGEDLKNLYWQAGYGQDRQGPKIKAEFFLAFNGIAVSVPSPLVEQIRELPYVKSVERDQTVQIAGDLDAAPQVDLIGAPEFWGQGFTGKYQTVAILDTGVDLDHPDLKDNIRLNQSEIDLPACLGAPLDFDQDGVITISDLNHIYQAQKSDPAKFNSCVNDFDFDGQITGKDLIYRENTSVCDGAAGTPSSVNPLIDCLDEDGNHRVDDLLGWNFYGVHTNPGDDHYHGTHCAGIAAGNGEHKGVAPEASILAVKVLNQSGSGSWTNIIAGIDYVINAPYAPLAQVISMSLGSIGAGSSNSDISQAVDRAVDAGVVVAVAAGNAGGSSFTIGDPGTSRKAITVGASLAADPNYSDGIAGFSSKGPVYPEFKIKPDLSAPGVGICAARYDTSRPDLLLCGDQTHISLSGTSMSTPHIAGAVLLLRQKYPQFSPEQIKSLLMQTALDLNLPAHYQGAGRVDLKKASAAEFLVSPQKIEFGEDDQSQDSWQSPTVTVTVSNLSGSDHSYQLLPAGQFGAGAIYRIEPAGQLPLAPGAFADFQVSLTVNNSTTGSADYPGYLQDHLNVIVDQNNASPAASLDAFLIKTCMVTAGCSDCQSNLQIDLYDDTHLFTRFLSKNSIKIPFKCDQPFNVFVTNWPPNSTENTYFFVQDNNSAHPNASILFSKAGAQYKYLINPRDKSAANFAWNTVSMAMYGRFGLKQRIIPPAYDYNPGLVFNVYSYAALPSRFLTIYFNRISDRYEFSWDIYAQKSNRYYQFSDYLGNGISSNLTFQNNIPQLRNPRISFPALPDGQSYSLAYGYKGAVIVPSNTTTSDLFYFTVPKSSSNENIRIPAVSFVNPAGVNNSFYMPGIRASEVRSRLNIYRTVAEGARSNEMDGLEPSLSCGRNELKLFQPPVIWYGVARAYLIQDKMYLILTHKNFQLEKERKMYSIVSSLFANQTGEGESLKLSARLTDSNGASQELSLDNLIQYNNVTWPQGIPVGPAQLSVSYPEYYFRGQPGLSQLDLTFDPHDDDLSPPYIDNFTLTANELITDTFYANTTNLITVKVSDFLPGEDEMPEPILKLYYRVFNSGENWRELEQSWPGVFLFDRKYEQPVEISLKIAAWDLEGSPENIPAGNSLQYVVEPAFQYDPATVCSDLPPLPGGFYFSDADGDGDSRIVPEWEYLVQLLKNRPQDTDFQCILPKDRGTLVMDLDGNGIIDTPDLFTLYDHFADPDYNQNSGNASYLEIQAVPQLDLNNPQPGKISALVESSYGRPRAGFGVEYKLVSNPLNCVTLTGRNPHPDWLKTRDQYLSVTEEGKSVFGISDEFGLSEIQVQLNPSCPSETQVMIEACVPADRERMEYCSCADPATWFICYCQSGLLPEGCDCNNPATWGDCGAGADLVPANCTFDCPYHFANKQDQTVCAEPILIPVY